MTEWVLPYYDLNATTAEIKAFGSGLINHTWKVSVPGSQYILQKINTHVFTKPQAIADNISIIASYLRQHSPGYTFTAPVVSKNGEEMIAAEDGGHYRLFPFVPGSISFDVATSPELAYEAALQFGRFTKLLSGLDITRVQITIPDFHNLGLRYSQFLAAAANTASARYKQAAEQIDWLIQNSSIANEYEQIQTNPAFKKRVTHHDTKISNVLFDKNNKGLCVIDLDTVMPGYFISDVGDMMRTYLSPVSEEEKDFSKIGIRKEFYRAIVEGYLSEMKDVLTPTEKQYFFYAGKFNIYMQALRFLTDYLNDDIYYGSTYPGHNFVRASNQIVLLQKFIEAAPELHNIGINS